MHKGKSNKLYLLVISLLLIAIVILCMKRQLPFNITNENSIEEKQVTINNTDLISVPCLNDQILSKEHPNIFLNNPAENDVYFVYEVRLGDNILYQSAAIPPNHTIKINLYDKLKKGNYYISLKLKTYDVKTKAESNGVNSSFEVVVK